ncbi:Acyl-CoA synthetase (AMP-forming)/AMP-acid ligase II [Paenibacillus sophorae]|uniref:AMP-binding protein n=1 Tax=Paenibacillus sophorae TaxID=1333845 RepID=A0A1H8V7S4_9BACL|nr:AMP-binding protein [Paenibacillus sophorae]QWU13259.1 AMP-binding protein [Paenibacillus sophorae]SEP11485.1 Acyl-CoA synthetase (AMP-forming)/AMP-acid ligase II [Paenibacillus sophorae]
MRNRIVREIESVKNEYKEKIAFIELEKMIVKKRVTYLELFEKISIIEKKLENNGLRNTICLLYFQSGIDVVATLLACFSAGVIPILRTISPNLNEKGFYKQFFDLVKEVRNIGCVLVAEDLLNLSEECKRNKINFMNVKTEKCDRIIKNINRVNETKIDADIIQLTSGSMKNSKLVKIRDEQLFANLNQCKKMWSVNEESTTVTWAPHSHIFGLVTGYLLPLYTGGTSVIMKPSDFSEDPVLWLEHISRFKATHSAGTNFAFQKCWENYDKERVQGLNLRTWKVASIGGEIVKHSTLKNFYEKYKKHEFDFRAFSPSYGMSENSGVVSSLLPSDKYFKVNVMNEALTQNKIVEQVTNFSCEIVSVGTPLIGTKIMVVDTKSGRELCGKEVGEILISSPSLCNGYMYGDNEDSFRLIPGNNGEIESYFKTGDLGFLKEGQLYITGRKKEIIISKGKNYSPYEIEKCAKKISDTKLLGDGAVFSVEEKIVLFQEILEDFSREKIEKLQDEIKNSIKIYLNLKINEVIFLKEGQIPRTMNGKIQRLKCSEIYKKIGTKEIS